MANKAVLCGINNYKSISDLQGCVNDVHNLRRLLIETMGFDTDNIKTHVDKEVTKKTVQRGFKWLADGATKGDRLIFHFSGHGSHIASKNSDEEDDELICLYDMSWSDSNSYLIDDDLGELTRLVKSGRLTVILDSCHSGSGTRAITADYSFSRSVTTKSQLIIIDDTANQLSTGRNEESVRRLEEGNSALLKSFREGRERPVFARYVEPPAKYLVKVSTRKVKRLGTKLRADMNHQLLAGARDDQTAADAYIEGQYNGAFTFYLCNTAREHGKMSYEEIMKMTLNAIRDKGYKQIPQNEGPFGSEALFGGKAIQSISTMPPGVFTPGTDSLINSALKVPGGPEPLTLLADLLRVSEKLIDLSATQSMQVVPFLQSSRAQGNELVIYVHGISQHRSGYSEPWFDAMQPHLDRGLQRAEVLWSPVVNPRSGTRSSSQELDQLAHEIERELTYRIEAIESRLSMNSQNARLIRPRGSGISIDDFTRYMLVKETREKILKKFDEIVRPLLLAGKKLHIISHSWGTAVSYEGLRRLDSDQFEGQVANLFFAGSALSIPLVRSNLFQRLGDGRKPRIVNQIINLDASGDIVGGSIGNHFTVDREFLGLSPTGCRKIPFTDIALNPACAHRSYFKAANEEVNRTIFAKRINEA